MRSDKTYVDAGRFEAILIAAGFARTEGPLCTSGQYTEMAGFVKVQGPKGRQLYVAKTKRVARVDLSGFEVDASAFGTNNLGGLAFGAVKQQLRFDVEPEKDAAGKIARTSEDIICENFGKVLDHMKTLPERTEEKKAKGAGAGKAKGGKPLGWASGAGTPGEGGEEKPDHKNAPAATLIGEDKRARLALIAKAAFDRGVSLSGKALETFGLKTEDVVALFKGFAAEALAKQDGDFTEKQLSALKAAGIDEETSDGWVADYISSQEKDEVEPVGETIDGEIATEDDEEKDAAAGE